MSGAPSLTGKPRLGRRVCCYRYVDVGRTAPVLALPLREPATSGDLEELSDLWLTVSPQLPLDEVIRSKIGLTVEGGDRSDMGRICLQAAELLGGERTSGCPGVISDLNADG
jgi:hypothetical protein